MNELIFFLHIAAVVAFTFAALKLGKEALMGWVAFQGVLANLFVVKQMTLFTLNVTCSDVYAVGSFLSLNLLQEFYDQPAAKKAALIALLTQTFFLAMSQFHLFYIPSDSDYSHHAFTVILQAYPRILISSLTVFFLIQQLDIRVFQRMKAKWPTSSFAWRNMFSLALSQFLDTVLFSFLGLYGIVDSVWDIIIMSFAIKLLLILIASPLTAFIKYIKHAAVPL